MAADAGKQTEQIAWLVMNVLGNPVSRTVLKFCTADCKCGKRADLALKSYYGEKPKMCIKCKTSTSIISFVLDYFSNNGKIDKNEIILALKDPVWRKGLSTTLEGIAEFGVKKPFTGSAPFLIVWNITKACNLRCKHCYEDAHIKAPDELSTAEALKAVDRMSDYGIAYLALSGGEPLSRPDFFQIAKRIGEKEMGFSIATNATLITPQIAKKLKDSNCLYAQVSVDGADAKTHNSFRGRNSFQKTMKGIKNLVDAKVMVGIACTVTRHNVKQVPKVIALAEKLGVQFFMHYNFIPTGRGKDIINMDITPQERENLLKMLAEQNGKRKVTLLSTAPQFARVCSGFSVSSLTHFDCFSQDPKIAEAASFLADFVGGCGTGRLYLAMEPNGDLLPCVFIQRKLGNLKTSDFKELWRSNPELLALRSRKNFIGNCSSCKFTSSCGGCRARSNGYYGDLTHADPGCMRNLKEWNALQKPS